MKWISLKKIRVIKQIIKDRHLINIKLSNLCKYVGVSRKMFYYNHKMNTKDLIIKDQVENVLRTDKYYGHKRIAMKLNKNKKAILRIMKKYSIKPLKHKTHRLSKKGDLKNANTLIPNHIKTLCPLKPNVVWSSDFTYIKYNNSFLFVCTVLDVFTREIVGVNISKYHNKKLVIDALIKSLINRQTSPMFLHSDQGSEYTSTKYKNILSVNNIVFSNSNKSSPWENGYQESFYAHFKKELGDINRFNSVEELIEGIYKQIYYYNNQRIHTKLKTTPKEYFTKSLKYYQFVRDEVCNKKGT